MWSPPAACQRSLRDPCYKQCWALSLRNRGIFLDASQSTPAVLRQSFESLFLSKRPVCIKENWILELFLTALYAAFAKWWPRHLSVLFAGLKYPITVVPPRSCCPVPSPIRTDIETFCLFCSSIVEGAGRPCPVFPENEARFDRRFHCCHKAATAFHQNSSTVAVIRGTARKRRKGRGEDSWKRRGKRRRPAKSNRKM